MSQRIAKSIKIRPDIHKKARIYAIENNMQFSDVVEMALIRYLNRKKDP